MTLEDNRECNKVEQEFYAFEKDQLWGLLFQQIKVESTNKDFSWDEAKKASNKYLNRYRDVNPYDHSRVELSKEEYNYINASFLNVEEARRRYILTQGPLPNTIVHFWLMVWEQNSRAIIMLNKTVERNQNKCSQYWPELIGTDNSMMLPQVDLKVELISEQDHSHYVVRIIRLTNEVDSESRNIIQFHYTTWPWPDFGVPQSPATFLKFLRDIRRSDAFKSQFGPPIVHCSAGIGRSGTLCLVDACLVMMENKGIENVSIKKVLLEMRKYRMGLIQAPEQLKFAYIAIIQGLKVNWTAANDEGLPEDDSVFMESVLPNCVMDDAPPAPPRFSSLERPLPSVPLGSSDESESECSDAVGSDCSDAIDEETRSNVVSIAAKCDTKRTIASVQPILSNVPLSKKRKLAEAKEKSLRIQEKVLEMKQKHIDCEKRKKKRSSLLINLGFSFVALSGVVFAYFWYRR